MSTAATEKTYRPGCKAARVLEALRAREWMAGPIRSVDIAAELGMPRNQVSNAIQTLRRAGAWNGKVTSSVAPVRPPAVVTKGRELPPVVFNRRPVVELLIHGAAAHIPRVPPSVAEMRRGRRVILEREWERVRANRRAGRAG